MGNALVVGVVAFVAGAISAVAGLGIGSILTPLLALTIGVKLAVALPRFRTSLETLCVSGHSAIALTGVC